jgi:hypothetical protein
VLPACVVVVMVVTIVIVRHAGLLLREGCGGP